MTNTMVYSNSIFILVKVNDHKSYLPAQKFYHIYSTTSYFIMKDKLRSQGWFGKTVKTDLFIVPG